MLNSLFILLLVGAHVLLYAYFFFTVVAIFKGAAPIPSRSGTVRDIVSLADAKPGESVMDFGSGDGRILFALESSGALLTGVEINPFLYFFSKFRAWMAKCPRIKVFRKDLWKVDLSTTDVLIIYFVPSFMPRLQQKIWTEMKPGSRVISAIYTFPSWTPARVKGRVYEYIVPPAPQ